MPSAEERFADLYQSFFLPVHAYCRRRTVFDRVDDAAAEAFLVAWRRIDEVPDGDDALPWLYQAAFGVISNIRRGRGRQKRLREKLHAAGVEFAQPPEDFVIRRHQSSEILKALDRLSRNDQEILRLMVWEDLTYSQVSVAMGISLEATRQRLSRAKRRLAHEYDRMSKDSSTSASTREGGTP